ncbi:MAG: cysteine desulfurase [Ignavibacteriales bacterium]|nr:cysteine desulfurase [Ignavibacteriales bacterium]
MRKVYLDYTSTTPCHHLVIDAMKELWGEKYGNPSSFHSFGREARALLDNSREIIAHAIGAHPSEIIFVSGGTEAINYAIKGISQKIIGEGKNHIITSATEHSAVLETVAYLNNQRFDVTRLRVGEDGLIDLDDLRSAITNKTGLISIMHVNNETGVIHTVEEISSIAKERGIIFFSDSVQSFGKIPVNVSSGADLLSFSAHKIYGPKGIGALFVRRGLDIEKYFHGGGQERGRRAGTESVPLAVGFGRAVELFKESFDDKNKLITRLNEMLLKLLQNKFHYIIINGNRKLSVPHIVNISFDSNKINMDGDALLYNLDLDGIAVTSGSACSTGTLKPSHVLMAMGRNPETARASLRISIGNQTSEEDIIYFVDRLELIVKRIGKQI